MRQITYAPTDQSAYQVGEKVRIALVFNEIVTSQNITIIRDKITTATYAGGIDSNVLYYDVIMATECSADTLQASLNHSGTVVDLSAAL